MDLGVFRPSSIGSLVVFTYNARPNDAAGVATLVRADDDLALHKVVRMTLPAIDRAYPMK